MMPTVLDLQFQGVPEAIASYLIPHDDGAVLVETGPGSTTDALEAGLKANGFAPEDVTDVLVTHIHLDHAGAAGWCAQHGATVYVHHVGAKHLAKPYKLLASAERIYGDEMDRLWGTMIPVPSDQLVALDDGDVVTVGDLTFEAVDTPGHAFHHMAYLHDGTCFSGDVAGVRLPGCDFVEPPLPPPEIHLAAWRESLQRLRDAAIDRLALTHFGLYDDVDAHLAALAKEIDAAEAFAREHVPDDPDAMPSDDAFTETVRSWMASRARAKGTSDDDWARYETANPSSMAAVGLKRWRRKYDGDPADA